MIDIENIVTWSVAVPTDTAKGPRMCRTAQATGKFWDLWNIPGCKVELQSLGVSARKTPGNKWEVFQLTAPTEAQLAAVPAPVVVAEPVMVWSDEQQAIFEHFKSSKRNAVVKARAGTGKTTTIKAAFSYAPEDSMLYAVFNKKNQEEAKAKISDPRVDVRTLHSLGFMFIKQMWPAAAPDKTNIVEKDRIIAAVPSELIPNEVLAQIVRLVAFAKNTFVAPTFNDLVELADFRGIACEGYEAMGWTVEKLAEVALKALELAKLPDAQGRISFDDMVWLPVAQNWVHAWYDLVCIDEAQDMNMPQLLMARRACTSEGRVIVVGDDRQAIYGFRGAAQGGMEVMARELDAIELSLTITYRCPKAVVRIANEVVSDYHAAQAAPEGEVKYIAQSALEGRVVPGDAILSRANAPLMPICLSLLRAGMPARIEGRDIGKMLLGIVKSLRAKSVPHFIGKVDVWAKKQRSRIAAGSPGAEERHAAINDQAEVLVAVAQGVDSVQQIEARLQDLFQDSNGYNVAAVVLSSVHKAKGLEWNRVHLLRRTFKADKGGEEANIYYVAVTRAKQTLVFVEDDSTPQEFEVPNHDVDSSFYED